MTIEEFLKCHEIAATQCPNWEYSEHILRDAFPIALTIIWALTTKPAGPWGERAKWRFNTNRMVAEQILASAGENARLREQSNRLAAQVESLTAQLQDARKETK